MDNFIIIAVLALIISGAGLYVFQQKKKGVKCIGCPNGRNCEGNCCSCNADNK